MVKIDSSTLVNIYINNPSGAAEDQVKQTKLKRIGRLVWPWSMDFSSKSSKALGWALANLVKGDTLYIIHVKPTNAYNKLWAESGSRK